ncbi:MULTISPECIES: protocatechuate 3,4-dioxygenase [unclassified Pseudomonas]|uniref:DODA-type extradiol aromatic ring-opening family dioxygenase n=1 Tax=unclassified Pseudomonas TaxID=196821 RepID=UPI00057C55B8|nr:MULTISPECIES: protocatechuate 3,4-dioxygenase [unclassified Pseudomonas]AMK37580.1 12-dihydroxynaphthalene dioxygenase [Pseudomonas sp. C5pp]KIC79249.1 protocatechuate 3,4-dioxygenase [Pseudomonas sp. C5pp]
MAQIVAGFMLPHDPLIAAMPDAPPQDKRDNCMNAYAKIADRLRELCVDTVIVIGDDHYTIHGPACIPSCLIGIGDVEGPWEEWLGIKRDVVINNEPLAHHIMSYGFDNGVDWAVSKAMILDHSTSIPIHYAVRPAGGVRAIPVYINSGCEPLISSRRAYEIGKVISEAVACWKGNERVAIFGTGGLSHWPGMAEMGKVNPEWDHQVMELVKRGDVEALVFMSDEEILNNAGNGGLEIKNWICAMGALAGWKGEIIAYEAVTEWVCGCGYMEMKPS